MLEVLGWDGESVGGGIGGSRGGGSQLRRKKVAPLILDQGESTSLAVGDYAGGCEPSPPNTIMRLFTVF